MSAVAPVVTYQRQPNGNWVPVVPSPDGTAVVAPSTAAIIDAAGNRWTIGAAGIVAVNGGPDLSTYGVTEIAYVGGLIWQSNGTLWYSKAVSLWSSPGVAVSPVAPTTAVLSWTPPTKNTDGTAITGLTGYVISYGQTTALTNTVNVGPVSTYTFSLAAGTWYFAIKAVNSFNVDSAESAVVSKVIT